MLPFLRGITSLNISLQAYVGTFKRIWQPLEQVFTAGIGLPRTVNKHLKYSIHGFLSDSICIDKVVMLVLLKSPGLGG